MNNSPTIILLGASLNTGNLGVSALGCSSVRLLLDKWPDAKVEIVGADSTRQQNFVNVNGSNFNINSWPVRFCCDPFVTDHFWKLLFGILLIRIFPFLRSRFAKQQSTFGAICRADIIADITGGDSFSDLYGSKRLFLGYLRKRLCQLTAKPFIMLPQTYGPFKSFFARHLAKRILTRSSRIFSRDKEGLSVVKRLIGDTDKVSLSPDIAFILEPKTPDNYLVSSKQLNDLSADKKVKQVVGLNISGLLYNGGYTGSNEFSLECDYRNLVKSIVEYFAELPDLNIMLIPHVVSEKCIIENDLVVCRALMNEIDNTTREKVFIAQKDGDNPYFDQHETKYLIGKCDFFLGSRMHATIAAVSQCVPTVALAYSKKFAGVYETIGIEDCVIDLRHSNNDKIIEKVKFLYESSDEIRRRLERNIPDAKEKIFSVFNKLNYENK